MGASVRGVSAFTGASALIACALLFVAPASGERPEPTRSARAQAPVTVYRASPPGLLVKLWVSGQKIIGSETGSRVKCEGGGSGAGSISSRGWKRFPIAPDGRFERQARESYEGSGDYFLALSGQVRPNRIVGEYRAWEERMGEEEFFPRCGTVTPRGLDMHFVAHRVDGPPWSG